MRCPNCDNELMYEEQLDEYYDDRSHDELWLVKCCSCDFQGKLWENYRLESEEWQDA